MFLDFILHTHNTHTIPKNTHTHTQYTHTHTHTHTHTKYILYTHLHLYSLCRAAEHTSDIHTLPPRALSLSHTLPKNTHTHTHNTHTHTHTHTHTKYILYTHLPLDRWI